MLIYMYVLCVIRMHGPLPAAILLPGPSSCVSSCRLIREAVGDHKGSGKHSVKLLTKQKLVSLATLGLASW